MQLITSRSNERVKEFALLACDGGERRKKGLCALEGVKLCEEAAKRGLLRELWATNAALEKHARRISDFFELNDVVEISQPVAEKLRDQKTPQGIFGLAALPDDARERIAASRRALVLCSVQDSVNVGTALRTAAAFGYAVILSGSCADRFSPRTLRTSMGAAFSADTTAFERDSETLEFLKANGFSSVALALNDNALPIEKLPRAEKLALLIGNEGGGLGEQTVNGCEHAVIIPITDAVESLNAAAAAAVAMWELR